MPEVNDGTARCRSIRLQPKPEATELWKQSEALQKLLHLLAYGIGACRDEAVGGDVCRQLVKRLCNTINSYAAGVYVNGQLVHIETSAGSISKPLRRKLGRGQRFYAGSQRWDTILLMVSRAWGETLRA